MWETHRSSRVICGWRAGARARRSAWISLHEERRLDVIWGTLDLDREQLLVRLQNLGTILPVFAEELAGARRQVTRLRLENSRLQEQVRQLQCERAVRSGTRARALVR
jgi:hypothetical protein